MNQAFPTEPATPNVTGPRIAAAVIDIVILMLVMAVFTFAFGQTERDGGNVSFNLNGWPFVAYAATCFLYYGAFEWSMGATPGKLTVGLRVVADGPGELTLGQVALRTVLRIVDGLPIFYLAGLVAVAASRKHQRLGDIAARTLVTKAPATTARS